MSAAGFDEKKLKGLSGSTLAMFFLAVRLERSNRTISAGRVLREWIKITGEDVGSARKRLALLVKKGVLDKKGEGDVLVCTAYSDSDVPYHEIVDLYNSICVELPKCRELSERRKRIIRARWKEHPEISFWRNFFTRVHDSDFLSGRKTEFRASFDWILKDSNFIKICEGHYDNRTPRYSYKETRGLRAVQRWLEKEKLTSGGAQQYEAKIH